MIKSHPYKSLPRRQYWSSAVAKEFVAAEVANIPFPLIKRADRIVTAGSCFAANLIPYLEKNGFRYLRTEYAHSLYRAIPAENLSYAKFSAGYGNIYTARQLYQLLLRCQGRFTPTEDRWVTEEGILDPFRPGLRYHASSEREHELLTVNHLLATQEAFSSCDVLIFTLGLTEAWQSKIDGAVFPACPGTITGKFDPELHEFKNFNTTEVIYDLQNFIQDLRKINPKVRVLLTVSPVPLVATATNRHVLAATTYSKAVLRVAAEVVCNESENVYYFPAYEVITGPQAPSNFFEADRRNVTPDAICAVMDAFLAICEREDRDIFCAEHHKLADLTIEQENSCMLSKEIADLECEEAAMDN